MKIDKRNSNKRKYNFPYRPFFWSLNVKTVTTISGQHLDGDGLELANSKSKPK